MIGGKRQMAMCTFRPSFIAAYDMLPSAWLVKWDKRYANITRPQLMRSWRCPKPRIARRNRFRFIARGRCQVVGPRCEDHARLSYLLPERKQSFRDRANGTEAPTGGSVADSRPSRLDGRCALRTGRSVAPPELP